MIRKILQIALIAIIAMYSNAFATTKSTEHNISKNQTKTTIKTLSNAIGPVHILPYAGFRHDLLQWSYGVDYIDKLSELTWKNKIAEVGVEVLTEPRHNQFNFLGSIKYGKILDDSENQDSDWDPFGEFSRTFSKVKGNTFDISGAIGISQDRYSKFPYAFVTHYFGFDYNYSNSEQFGLTSTINRLAGTPLTFSIGQVYPKSKLVSKYKYHNYAPWYGINLYYKLNDKLSFAPFVKAYLFGYNAEADWVLRSDFAHDPSFRHRVFGVGLSLDAKLLFKATNSLDIYANLGIKKLGLINGTDTMFFCNGTSHSKKLKELKIITKILGLGAKLKF